MVTHFLCDEYNVALIEEKLRRIIELNGGLDALLKKGKKVLIKPNLVMRRSPEYAATTHPAVVEALVRILKEKTDDITLTECSGGPNTSAQMEGVFKTSGMTEVCERLGVKMNLDLASETRRCPNARAAASFECQKIYSQCDVFINVAKLKSHSLTLVSGAPKNLYGTIPGLKKTEYHSRFPDNDSFAKFILDINETVPADLNIVDAIDIMEGNGPTGGTCRHMGSLLGGKNAFEVDVVSCRLLGIDYKKAPIPALAVKEGVASGDPEITGDIIKGISDFKLPDSKHFSLLNFFVKGRLRRFVEPRPVVDTAKCIGCMRCAEVCPRKTIVSDSTKNVAKINHDGCIKCFCCHELCPKTAIKIKRNPLMNL